MCEDFYECLTLVIGILAAIGVILFTVAIIHVIWGGMPLLLWRLFATTVIITGVLVAFHRLIQ